MQQQYVWSYRFSVARGWQWSIERAVSINESLRWLDIFKRDEPGVLFVLSCRKPRA